MADEGLKKFSQKMLAEKVFNCTSCKLLLSIPIIQVQNVGNVCQSCFQEKYSSETNFRNDGLETVLCELILPCKYSPSGCKDEMTYKLLEQHHTICRFRTMKCLISDKNCPWEGLPKEFGNHFLQDHKEHVIESQNNLFIYNLSLKHDSNVIKLLKNKVKPMFFAIKINQESNTLSYLICDANINYYSYKYTIKHIGQNSNQIDVNCKVIPLSKFSTEQSSEEIQVDTLKQVTGVDETVFLVIKSELNEMDEKWLESFECPVCNNLMKAPIFMCKSGHSFCNMCQPKLTQCPTCKAELTNARNYSLESLTSGVFYDCSYKNLGCEETLPGSDISKHETFCVFKPAAVVSSLPPELSPQVLRVNNVQPRVQQTLFESGPFDFVFGEHTRRQPTPRMVSRNAGLFHPKH